MHFEIARCPRPLAIGELVKYSRRMMNRIEELFL